MKKQKKHNSFQFKILVSTLDWGLGHATRCIPVITELIKQNFEIFIAAAGPTFFLLKSEFPQVTFLPILSYKVKFSKRESFFSWKIAQQLPNITAAIYKEHMWLKRAISNYNIDAVISDNRFGLYNSKVYTIYITHQLQIKTGNFFTEKIANYLHRFFIKKYNECWIPDFESNGLAGELSHPETNLEKVKYMGALSRFEKRNDADKKYDLLVLLSGPEPQRTILEELLLKQLTFYAGKVLLVRGLPGNNRLPILKNSYVTVVNHLPGGDLNIAMEQAEIIISRSGYTTVMDLVKLNKKAILIPTPGQKEQEYLAYYLMKKKMFFSVHQTQFDLRTALKNLSEFSPEFPVFDMQQYKKVIREFARKLRE